MPMLLIGVVIGILVALLWGPLMVLFKGLATLVAVIATAFATFFGALQPPAPAPAPTPCIQACPPVVITAPPVQPTPAAPAASVPSDSTKVVEAIDRLTTKVIQGDNKIVGVMEQQTKVLRTVVETTQDTLDAINSDPDNPVPAAQASEPCPPPPPGGRVHRGRPRRR